MTDPYEILEVPRDADAGTIKRAYRRKAQKAHPDRDQSTGSGDRFRALQIAYDVLSDPARRARYDETGETHEGPTIETQALAYVAGLLHAMLDVVVDVEHFALGVQMKKQCEDELRNVRIGMAKLRDLQGRRRRALKRISGPRLGAMVEAEIRQFEDAIAKQLERVEILQMALQIIDKHDYQADVVMPTMDTYAYRISQINAQGGVI